MFELRAAWWVKCLLWSWYITISDFFLWWVSIQIYHLMLCASFFCALKVLFYSDCWWRVWRNGMTLLMLLLWRLTSAYYVVNELLPVWVYRVMMWFVGVNGMCQRFVKTSLSPSSCILLFWSSTLSVLYSKLSYLQKRIFCLQLPFLLPNKYLNTDDSYFSCSTQEVWISRL